MSIAALSSARPRNRWRTITSAAAIPNTVVIGIEITTMSTVR